MTGSITVISRNDSSRTFNTEVKLVIASGNEKFVFIFNPDSYKDEVSSIGMNNRSVCNCRELGCFFSCSHNILCPFDTIFIGNYFKFTGLVNNTIPFQTVFKFTLFLFSERFAIEEEFSFIT